MVVDTRKMIDSPSFRSELPPTSFRVPFIRLGSSTESFALPKLPPSVVLIFVVLTSFQFTGGTACIPRENLVSEFGFRGDLPSKMTTQRNIENLLA